MKKREFWIRDLRNFLTFGSTPVAKATKEDTKGKRSPKIEDQKTGSSSRLGIFMMSSKNPLKILSLYGLLVGISPLHKAYGAIPTPKPKPEALVARNPEPPSSLEATNPPSSQETPSLITIHALKEFGQIKISLEGVEPKTGCALFQSQDGWYLVLENHYPVNIESFQEEDLKPLQKLRCIESLDSTTLVTHIPSTYTPKIDLQNPHFTLIFQESELPSSPPILIRPTTLEEPVVINFREAQKEYTVFDDEAGKQFFGYTSVNHHEPITPFTYPEFTLLPSIKGMALEVKSDTIDIEDDHGRLKISGVSATPFIPNEPVPIAIQNFPLFKGFDIQEGIGQKQSLEKQLSMENGLATYLQLGWTDLSLGYVPEATAALTNLTKFHPQFTVHPIYVTFSGLLKLLSRHASEFLSLDRPYFRDQEIKVIANLIDIALNPYESSGNMPPLVEIKPFILSLPQQLKEELISFILIHGVYNKSLPVLSTYLKEEFIPQDPNKLNYYQLAYATYLSLTNKPKKAIEYYQALAKNYDSPFIATVAEFELVNQRINEKRITPRAAIDALDRLRYQWRGDSLEYYITQKLITVLWSEQDFPRALTIMRKLIRYYPKQCQNDKVFEKMQEGLMAYFTKDAPFNVLEMLSIYQEFGDIAPDTAKGDQVILKAIEGMVQLNLFSESARLLKNYLKKKIQSGIDSVERQAKILLRIAAIELMDNRGEGALKILKNAESWPQDFRGQAIELKADALISLKKFEEALALTPQEPAFELKRAHIYFKMGHWQDAAQHYTQALELYHDNPEKKAHLLINLAICYALEERNNSLKELKNHHWDFMKTTAQKDVFAFLTTLNNSSKSKDLMTNLAYVDKLTGLAEHILQAPTAEQK